MLHRFNGQESMYSFGTLCFIKGLLAAARGESGCGAPKRLLFGCFFVCFVFYVFCEIVARDVGVLL